MSNVSRALAIAIAAGTLAGCVAHGPQGVAYTRGDGASVGATVSAGGGAVGAEVPAAAPAEKEQRGNTPPGMDRDGHGPAAGAILDPTGAATGAKPY